MDGVDIKIGDELIRPVIEAKIQAAIIEALSDEKGLIERVVTSALTEKVKTSDSYSSERIPWIEKLCREIVQDSAKEAIRQWAESKKEAITAEFLRQLSTQRTSKAVVSSMIDGLVRASENHWRFKVDFPER